MKTGKKEFVEGQLQEKRSNLNKKIEHKTYDFIREDWKHIEEQVLANKSLFDDLKTYMKSSGNYTLRTKLSDKLNANKLNY